MTFVIIGGDAAGMSAGSKAKRSKPDLNVTVVEKTGDVSYSACGMPYNIADPNRPIDDLVVRSARVFRDKQGINLLTNHQANKIDPTGKTVTGATGTGTAFSLPYDKLLIATGASPIIPDIPGINLPGVTALKSLAQGREIKNYIHDHSVEKVVIIGMGYIALEMCEALRTRGIQVDLVKPGPVFLPWMAEELSQVVKGELENNGARVFSGHAVQKIEKQNNGLHVVCSDLTLKAHMVLVAIGVYPNSRLAEEAGLELGPNRSIAVDARMRTSNPDIYAAGDCADAFHIVTGKRVWVPLALRANRAGWAAADNICGREMKLSGIAGTAVFKVFDLQVARTGLTCREAVNSGFDPVETVIKTQSRAHAHPGSNTIYLQMVGDKKSGRLLGMIMVGNEGVAHRINAPAVALHGGMSVARFSQSDLAYAPPFGPVWDPMLTTANQLLKIL